MGIYIPFVWNSCCLGNTEMRSRGDKKRKKNTVQKGINRNACISLDSDTPTAALPLPPIPHSPSI